MAGRKIHYMVTDTRGMCEARVDSENSTLVEKRVTCDTCLAYMRRNEILAR